MENNELLKSLFAEIEQRRITEESLREQLAIIQAISRDYIMIIKIDLNDKMAAIIKRENDNSFGKEATRKYPYDALYRQYINDRVYPGDAMRLYQEMSLENVEKELMNNVQFTSQFRGISGAQIHHYQYVFSRLDGDNSNILIVAFKNIDSIVNATKEKKALIVKSETDGMTGVLNRASGEKRVAEAINRGVMGMLCICDIDNFKSVNDTFGHSVGDKAIIEVANCFKKTFRERDIVFRLGGDEFAILAVNVGSIEEGRRIAGRIFDHINRLAIPELGERKLSVSIGATMVNEDSEIGFEELYKRADSCVYLSKKQLGNYISFYEEN